MNRDKTLDIIKCIGIILMVIYHSRVPDYIGEIIVTFVMPLFFISSGWFFSEQNVDDYRGFAVRKLKTIYWPYLKWCVIFLLLHNVFYSVGILNGFYGSNGVVNHEYDIKEMATLAIDFTFRMTRYEGLLGAYWFVRSLLWGSLLLCFSSALMCRLTKLNKTTCVSSVAVIFGIMGGGNFSF